MMAEADLPAALENILKQLANGSEIQAKFHVAGNPRRLAPAVENNLFGRAAAC